MSNTLAIRKSITPSDVYRMPVLEDISVAAFQGEAGSDFPNQEGGFVARAWFPTIPENDQSFKYLEIDMDSISQNKAQPRAPGTKAEEGSWNASFKTVLMGEYGYREKLPEELVATMPGADSISALSVAEVLAISDEVRVAAKAWTTGVWGRDIAGASTAVADTSFVYWNNSASTPIADILGERPKGKLKGKRRYNTMILGADVVAPLLTNPQVLARVVNGQRPGMSAQASLDDIANLFKVDRVMVADAVYNSANEGATATNGFIFNSKCAWIGYVNPTPSKLQPSAGYRFAWQGVPGGNVSVPGNTQGIRNWKYWDQACRSWWVEGALDDEFVIVTRNNGTFFNGIVQ